MDVSECVCIYVRNANERRRAAENHTHIIIHNLFTREHKLISFHRIAMRHTLKITHETLVYCFWLVNVKWYYDSLYISRSLSFRCFRYYLVYVHRYHHVRIQSVPCRELALLPWRIQSNLNRNMYKGNLTGALSHFSKMNYIFDILLLCCFRCLNWIALKCAFIFARLSERETSIEFDAMHECRYWSQSTNEQTNKKNHRLFHFNHVMVDIFTLNTQNRNWCERDVKNTGHNLTNLEFLWMVTPG